MQYKELITVLDNIVSEKGQRMYEGKDKFITKED